MNTSDFKRDDLIVIGIAAVLFIDLIALPWYSLGFASLSATDSPDSWAGILAMLFSLAVVADLGIERLSPKTTLPNIGGSRTVTRFVLAGGAALFVFIKFLAHVSDSFNYGGFGFWLGVILTAGLVYGTRRLSKDQSILPAS